MWNLCGLPKVFDTVDHHKLLKKLEHGIRGNLNKLNGKKKLYETDSVNFLGIQVDKNLSLKQKIHHVVNKLNEANFMLFKSKHVLDN